MNYDFPFSKVEQLIYRFYWLFIFKPCLKHLGKKAFISPYSRINHMECISIGDRSIIERGTSILAFTRYLSATYLPSIVIGNDVFIGSRCMISAATEIKIGDATTIGDHCYIADNRHGYEDINNGVLDQTLVTGSINIGPRAWIGYGSFIAASGSDNLEIGEHAIIAANSVVRKSVPSFTIVAGAPAKPVKHFDFTKAKWMRIS
jgi:acetyltransferase-like isoleucine patch superfamily enzyme